MSWLLRVKAPGIGTGHEEYEWDVPPEIGAAVLRSCAVRAQSGRRHTIEVDSVR
jgi:hypothetical protein